jgi:hypothetical protein
MKLIWVSTFTLAVISSFVFAVVMAVLVFTDSVDIPVAIGLTVIINVVLWLVGTDVDRPHESVFLQDEILYER